MTTREISNSDDIIDSRDVIARIEHLEQLQQPGPVDLGPEDNAQAQDDLFAELAALKALQDEADGYAPDWKYGATLVRDSYWVEYVQEILEDCGEIPKNLPHYIAIDWEATARNIQYDYTAVDFNGVTYWVR